jgi:hypothetical protein
MSAQPFSDGLTRNIVAALDLRDNRYQPAVSLRDVGVERILGRKVVAWSHSLGSYGMGGPGFFGLQLYSSPAFHAEWLVLTLWAADNWLLFDGQWVAAHPNQYHKQRPLVSYFGGDEDWDDLSEKLVHSTIVAAEIDGDTSRIHLEKGPVSQLLEIPRDTSLLPPHGGSLAPRTWNLSESRLDAWIISESGDLIT